MVEIKNIVKGTLKEKNVAIVLATSVFFLTTFPFVSLICWAGLFFYSIFKENFGSLMNNLVKAPIYFFMVLLYLFYLAGMLWTENYLIGWDDLAIKIPMLLFPFLFLTLPIGRFSYELVRRALIHGCLFAVILCFVRASSHYFVNHELHNFYYISFSYLMHPTYFTMFINLAILWLLDDLLFSEKLPVKKKIGDLFLLFLFISAVCVLSARLAMLTTFFTMIVFVLFEAIKRKNFKKMLPSILTGVVAIFLVSFFFINLNNRFIQMADVIENKADPTALKDTVNNTSYNSTTIRIGLFKNGLAIFKEHLWFGVGTGDVVPVSVKRLNDEGLHVLALKSHSAHNQYLQTAVTLGVFALLLLIFCICWPLYEFLKAKEYLFAAFMMIVLINAMGDTVLRASSLYFFTLFGCFFYRIFQKNRIKKM